MTTQTKKAQKATLTIRQYAALVGVSYSATYAAVRNDKLDIPIIRIGTRVVVPVQPVLDSLGIDEIPEDIWDV